MRYCKLSRGQSSHSTLVRVISVLFLVAVKHRIATDDKEKIEQDKDALLARFEWANQASIRHDRDFCIGLPILLLPERSFF